MLSRTFDHICMEKAYYKFLIIMNYYSNKPNRLNQSLSVGAKEAMVDPDLLLSGGGGGGGGEEVRGAFEGLTMNVKSPSEASMGWGDHQEGAANPWQHSLLPYINRQC